MTEEILEYEGKYWMLSSLRLSYMRERTRDDCCFILSLFAIAKETERSGHYVMIALQHGVLHREQAIAGSGDYCDYYITGNREKWIPVITY